MSTKAKIQKVRAEVEAHEERGWLRGYEEGLAVREEQTVNAQNANEKLRARIGELSRQKKGPKTAREALALAWELAHPVNSGDVIPKDMTCLKDNGDCITTVDHPTDWTPMFPENIRTIDPLPDPEPDWLDADAVVAFVKGQVSCVDPQVFARANKTGAQGPHDGYWRSSLTGLHYHWTDLIDVTPLYPKGQDE